MKTVIKRKNAAVATTAVAFHSSVLHSQLVDGIVQLRLNQLDPQAPPYDVPSTTQALWNALFKYFARGRDAPAQLDVEPVLPAEVLDSALLALGESADVRHGSLLRVSATDRAMPRTRCDQERPAIHHLALGAVPAL